MFSYRHAFHAGNHADVLKHTTLIALMKYLTQKDTALTVIDTHAGAGLYRLDGDYTETSGEASEGIFKLISASKAAPAQAGRAVTAIKKVVSGAKVSTVAADTATPAAGGYAWAPALLDYLELLRGLNPHFAQTGDPAGTSSWQRMLRRMPPPTPSRAAPRRNCSARSPPPTSSPSTPAETR